MLESFKDRTKIFAKEALFQVDCRMPGVILSHILIRVESSIECNSDCKYCSKRYRVSVPEIDTFVKVIFTYKTM